MYHWTHCFIFLCKVLSAAELWQISFVCWSWLCAQFWHILKLAEYAIYTFQVSEHTWTISTIASVFSEHRIQCIYFENTHAPIIHCIIVQSNIYFCIILFNCPIRHHAHATFQGQLWIVYTVCWIVFMDMHHDCTLYMLICMMWREQW